MTVPRIKINHVLKLSFSVRVVVTVTKSTCWYHGIMQLTPHSRLACISGHLFKYCLTHTHKTDQYMLILATTHSLNPPKNTQRQCLTSKSANVKMVSSAFSEAKPVPSCPTNHTTGYTNHTHTVKYVRPLRVSPSYSPTLPSPTAVFSS